MKAMNPNGDQVKAMLDLHPTAELFSSFKELNPEEAKNFAVRNPEFHRQALNDMGDLAFQSDVRMRISGRDSV